MMKVFIVQSFWNVNGDSGHEILGTYSSRDSAAERIAEEVNRDMQYCEWLDKVNFTECFDIDGKQIPDGANLPEKITYFKMYDAPDVNEYCLEYSMEQFPVLDLAPEEYNTMKIPDLTPMYNEVRDYIKSIQGEKGYVLTCNPNADVIWAMIYSDYESTYEEQQIYAIRVKNDTIQIVNNVPYMECDDEFIASLSDDDWYDIRYDDNIFFLPTIFNIAEAIQEYD